MQPPTPSRPSKPTRQQLLHSLAAKGFLSRVTAHPRHPHQRNAHPQGPHTPLLSWYLWCVWSLTGEERIPRACVSATQSPSCMGLLSPSATAKLTHGPAPVPTPAAGQHSQQRGPALSSVSRSALSKDQENRACSQEAGLQMGR